MSTTVELVRANERYARLRAAAEALADLFVARAAVDRIAQDASSDSPVEYWEGCADAMLDAAESLRALLAAVDS